MKKKVVSKSKNQRLAFKTNTLLKNLVGKDLINDDNIAIVELAKNSYDANSSFVKIRFTDFSKKSTTTNDSKIVISDAGIGMTPFDIKEKWLNIAYSDKKYTKQEHGAYYAGNKGIGRFSCDRLGEHLDLLTKTAGGKLCHLSINWPDFEIEGKRDLIIQDIKVSLSFITKAEAFRISGEEMPEQGTILVISKLRSVWNIDKLLEMKTMLERFLNPNQLFSRKQFRIEIQADELKKHDDKQHDYGDKVNGIVQNRIFNNLKFNATYIESKISNTGKTIITTLYHEGEKVFRLKEKNLDFILLKDVKVVIYYLNPYKKAYFKRQTGVRSIDFGSIFIFLNGFRISPYGERGDDWLGLDVRKSQGTSRYLGSRDVVGRIELLDTEEQFKPISSREGLKKTPALKQLKEDYFINVLRKLERFVSEGLGWDSIPNGLKSIVRADDGLDWSSTTEEYAESWERKKQRIALAIMGFMGASPEKVISFWFNPSLLEGVQEQKHEEVASLLDQIETFSPQQIDTGLKHDLKNIAKILAEKEKEVQAAKEEVSELHVAVAKQAKRISTLKKQRSTYQAQTLFLQSVSSLDATNLVAFHHQICLDSTIIDNHLAATSKAIRNGATKEVLLSRIEKIARANRRILAVAQFATKANFKAGTRKELTDIPAFIEQYLSNVAKDYIATNIKVDVQNSVDEAFEVKASKIELSIIVDNLISNANKALAKTLYVGIAMRSNNILSISFIDDGIGLSDEIQSPNDIFNLGITTTSGSGIGLYHVKQIVEEMDGSISAHRLNPNGLEIRMELPR